MLFNYDCRHGGFRALVDHFRDTSQSVSRLLVVDDDADILEALVVVLQDRHEITSANNGLEALGLLQAQPFDAIVLDLMMPSMDGETLIERMREAAIRVPVVLASASFDVAVIAVRLGVEHVQKPYDISVLEEKLVRLIRGATPTSFG